MFLNNYLCKTNIDNLKNKTFREVFIHNNDCYFVNDHIYYINSGDFIIEKYFLPNDIFGKIKTIKTTIELSSKNNSSKSIEFIIKINNSYYINYKLNKISNSISFPKICKEE